MVAVAVDPGFMDCPICGHSFDKDSREEKTVGSFTGHPHVICPCCKICCGCVIDDKKRRSAAFDAVQAWAHANGPRPGDSAIYESLVTSVSELGYGTSMLEIGEPAPFHEFTRQFIRGVLGRIDPSGGWDVSSDSSNLTTTGSGTTIDLTWEWSHHYHMYRAKSRTGAAWHVKPIDGKWRSARSNADDWDPEEFDYYMDAMKACLQREVEALCEKQRTPSSDGSEQ